MRAARMQRRFTPCRRNRGSQGGSAQTGAQGLNRVSQGRADAGGAGNAWADGRPPKADQALINQALHSAMTGEQIETTLRRVIREELRAA